jgi:hypothetical protein
MRLWLKLPRQDFVAGESVPLQVGLRNDGQTAISVPTPFDQRNWQPAYSLRRLPDATEVRFSARSASLRGADPQPSAEHAILIELPPGAEIVKDVPLQKWADLRAEGEYRLAARLEWNGLVAAADPVAFRIERARVGGAQLVLDEEGPRMLWIEADGDRPRLIEHFYGTHPTFPGEVRRQVVRVVGAVPAGAAEPFSPAARSSPAEALNFWRGWVEPAAVAVATADHATILRLPVRSDAHSVQDPWMSPSGELDVLVREGSRLRVLRYPKPSAGAPREAWSAAVPGEVFEAAAAERLDRSGRRHAAAVSAIDGGVVVWKLFADAAGPGKLEQVRAGEALPLAGSRIALDPAENGSCRAAVVYQRVLRRPGNVRALMLTLLQAGFGANGEPDGAPKLTDLVEPGEVPAVAAACCFHQDRMVFAALLADGRLLHNAGGSGVQTIAGRTLVPLQLLSFGRDVHVLIVPEQGGPQFVPLR